MPAFVRGDDDHRLATQLIIYERERQLDAFYPVGFVREYHPREIREPSWRNMRLLTVLLVVTAVCVSAASVNVALNKPVTLVGVFGNSTLGAWPDFPPAAAATLTDGVFVPDQQHWQQGTVWWNENDTLPHRLINIDLQGVFTLMGAIVQGDDNDTYLLEYQDTANAWHTLWTVPQSCCFGMTTRPNRLDNTQQFNFAPVTAQAIRIGGAMPSDKYYSLSEVQVFANAVPEPATVGIAAAGLTMLALLRKHTRK